MLVTDPTHPILGYALEVGRRWMLILTVTLSGLSAGVVAISLSRPVYEADLTLYVVPKISPNQSPDMASRYAVDMIPTYLELLRSDLLAHKVKDTSKSVLTTTQIQDTITTRSTSGSSVMHIAVRDWRPQEALQIADAIGNDFPIIVDQLDSSEGTRSVTISVVSPAGLQPSPVAPDRVRDVIMGGAAGLIAGLLAVWLLQSRGPRVHGVSDLRRLIDAPVLGLVASGNEQVPVQATAIGLRLKNVRTLALLGPAPRTGSEVTAAVMATLQIGMSPLRLLDMTDVGELAAIQHLTSDGSAETSSSEVLVIDGIVNFSPIVPIVAAQCDAALIVGVANWTRQKQITDLQAQLRVAGAAVIGGILIEDN